MFRSSMILMTAALLLAAGCGGDSPAPGFVFPDTSTDPGQETSAMDGGAEDAPVGPDGAGEDTGSDDAVDHDDVSPVDMMEDIDPKPDCETDHDCSHLTNDPCTFWFCHPTQKACKPATFPDGDPCDDDDVCTVGDVCEDGVCISGDVIMPPEFWDDPCNELTCDPLTGWHPKPVTGPCDDGNPCTEEDSCHAGVCVGGEDICTEPECGDGDCADLEHCDNCPEDCGSCETNCCDAHPGKGCDDPTCQDIICGQDVFCCNGGWDTICAQDAVQLCSICGSGPTCGDGDCDFGESCQSCPYDCDGGCNSNCCFTHQGSGCQSPACQDKVCGEDDFCCIEGWDDYCVDWAQDLCGICG